MFCYVHIPFCESKCKYCRFASYGGTSDYLKKKYIKKLLNDIELFDKKNEKLESIYFGGGTPSSISDKDIGEIISSLYKKFGFKKDIEISLETTPKFIDFNRLKVFSELGIDRLSIGIQSLNDKTLNEIGRGSKDLIISSLDTLQKQDYINNISLDFIIGLPFVKKGELKKDIEFVLNNYDFVKHISVYMLEDYYFPSSVIPAKAGIYNNDMDTFIDSESILSQAEDMVSEGQSKFENIYYPDSWENLGIKEEDYLGEYNQVKNYLEDKGYKRYEISNFSLKGFECKHNKAYWEHKDYIGFGLGSHSFVNDFRYSMKDDFDGYYKGDLSYKEKLSKKDLFLERLMFGFRTSGIEKDIYEKLDKYKLDKYLSDGYLQKKQDKIILTDKSFTILDYLIYDLL